MNKIFLNYWQLGRVCNCLAFLSAVKDKEFSLYFQIVLSQLIFVKTLSHGVVFLRKIPGVPPSIRYYNEEELAMFRLAVGNQFKDSK